MRPHKQQICGNVVGTELLETNYPHLIPQGFQTHGCCHYLGNRTVEVTKPNRNR